MWSRSASLNGFSRVLALLGCALSTLAAPAAQAQAQDSLPAVTVVLSLEVRDSDTWLEAYREIVATPTPSPKVLLVTMTQLTPRRSLMLLEPTFSATIRLQAIKVIAKGKITAMEAGGTLQAFVHGFLETGPNSPVRLDYGLSSFTASLVEVTTQER